MAYRDTEADTGRKGTGAGAQRRDNGHSYMLNWPSPKGEWVGAYGGGYGQTEAETDPDMGTPSEEVGPDRAKDNS